MEQKHNSMKTAQDEVEDLKTDLVTRDTLLAVFIVGVSVIAMWVAVWSLFSSRL